MDEIASEQTARGVEEVLVAFRATYAKYFNNVVLGTEDNAMNELYKLVLRGGDMCATETYANMYMPILNAWNAVKKARTDANQVHIKTE
jgi:hypothetical protein